MRTNIVLNDTLIDEAFKFSADSVSTKKDLVEIALLEYVNNRKRKSLKDLRGKIRFHKNYDHKSLRFFR
ncbi:MAG: type II toxin-antitoxin system VapB family antitoxin [Candidatus Margulisbacteria bacterium]|jgi:Arc/MetJ family transcription regulator|nr:type II toxin-antitoxin system VapB family antitoxin [Candidatus Margulisiibacteriota bacterium]